MFYNNNSMEAKIHNIFLLALVLVAVTPNLAYVNPIQSQYNNPSHSNFPPQ